jgi:hypothetical protein
MRFVSASILSLACAFTAVTAACTDAPDAPVITNDRDEEAALRLSLDQYEPAPLADRLNDVVEKSVFIGTRVMKLFGGSLQWLERIECGELTGVSETIAIGGCSYTVTNENCQSGWSEAYDQYVCTCDRYVTGASSDDCW